MAQRQTAWIGSIAALFFCLLCSAQIVRGQGLLASFFGRTSARTMTRGSRSLSLVNHVVDDYDTPTTETEGSPKMDAGDEKSATSKLSTHFISETARKTVVDSKSTSDSSSSLTSPASSKSSHKATARSNSSAPAVVASSTSKSSSNATKVSGNADVSGSSTKATEAPTKPKVTDPVVHDVSQFLDDELSRNVTHGVLPPERDQPLSWPLDVFAIFLGAAIVLFAATTYKTYQKRKAYSAVESNLAHTLA